MGCDNQGYRETVYRVQEKDLEFVLRARETQLVLEDRVIGSSTAHLQTIGAGETLCGKELGVDWKVIAFAGFICHKCSLPINLPTEKW